MKTLSNFVKRTLTGGIYMVAILASMLNFISFSILCYVLLLLTINEYAKMLKQKGIVISERKMGLAAFPLIATFIVCYSGSIEWLWLFVALFITGLLVTFSLELFHKKNHQMQNVAYSFFAYFYIALPFACLIYLYSLSPLYTLALFTFVWTHDTFSYLVGMKLGRTKLFERVSPQKTWEGFFGGLVATILAGVVFYYLATDDIIRIAEPTYHLWKWMGMAVVVVVAGTFGDLFESLLKRSLEIKDSGTLLPGHGGLFDRLDSILFAAPAVMVYLLF